TKKPFYKRISEEIIEFINREMTNTDGAFYSAIDADSEGVEGKYYVWRYDEIVDILGEELGELYTTVYDISPEGNFEGKNIPNLIQQRRACIEIDNLNYERQALLEKSLTKLQTAREESVYPHVDHKILKSWSAMVIHTLTKARNICESGSYTEI